MKHLILSCIFACFLALPLSAKGQNGESDPTVSAPLQVVGGGDTSTTVELKVNLTRAYVRSNSNLGGGAASQILLGPFSRNVINLYISEKGSNESMVKIHEQRMKWGDNPVKFVAHKSTDIRLYLRVGGSRAGGAELGTILLTSSPVHFYTVDLDASGVHIKGPQRDGGLPAATPAPVAQTTTSPVETKPATPDTPPAQPAPTVATQTLPPAPAVEEKKNFEDAAAEMEKKLLRLRKLQDLGLLTEAEYEAKRKEMVKKL